MFRSRRSCRKKNVKMNLVVQCESVGSQVITFDVPLKMGVNNVFYLIKALK
jgi:hypothetical protein